MRIVKFYFLMVVTLVSLISIAYSEPMAQTNPQDMIDSLKAEQIKKNFSRTSSSGLDISEESYSDLDLEETQNTIDSMEEVEDNEIVSMDTVINEKYNELDTVNNYNIRLGVDSTNSSLDVFGLNFIKNLKNSPNNLGPVNPSYRVGVGDEIVLIMWGGVEFTQTMVVNRIGTISPKGVGQFSVAGMSITEIKKSLIKRLSKVYSGVNYGKSSATTFVDVAIGHLRKKQVYIVGDVENPGSYSVSSLVGPLGILSYAGGPTKKGSMRDIYISRDSKIIDTVDLYNFLLNGKINDTVAIADQDVVIVPPIKTKVAISGAVHRPSIYELKNNESLADLLKYAGGFIPEAYTVSCNITRTFANNERRLITIDSIGDGSDVIIKKNDIVEIGFVDSVNNKIVVEGAVKRAGEFACTKGIRLLDAINLAGGVSEDYFPDRIEVLRTYENFNKEIIAVNLGELLKSPNSDKNITLRKWDIIKVYSKWNFENRKFVMISGEVARPGKYFLRDSMTVQDLILLAGGFTEKAYKKTIELSRIEDNSKVDGNIIGITRIDVDIDFYKSNSTLLKNMDNIFIKENSSLKEQEIVYLGGEFIYPGYYSKISDDETLLSLINRAGGLKKSAYLDGARFTRSKRTVGTVAINLKKLMKKGSVKEDIILEDGDSLVIPTEPKTVRVIGSVNYPTSVKYLKGANVSYYIKRAGGFASNANKKSIYVMLANGEVKQTGRHKKSVNAGSTITIPEKPFEEKVPFNWMAFTQALLGIATATVSIMVLSKQL